MKQLLVIIIILFFLCGLVFAAGNKFDNKIGDGISFSNKIYTSKIEANLLKTGQTISYHAGDDGDLELGLASCYTVLTTGQYAGSTNVTINSKTHMTSNACVQDNRTGKMWHREVIPSDIGPATDGKLFWDQYTLDAETCTCNAAAKTITADAGTPFSTGALCVGRIFTIVGSVLGNNGTFTVTNITTSVITVSEDVVNENSISLDFATVDDLIWDLVDQANANSLAGYTDWRMPNFTELKSIIIVNNDYMIDSTIFPSTPTEGYWTSTSHWASGGLMQAWYVRFMWGTHIGHSNKKTIKYHIRLIRN